jgi:hypothetical protein
MLLCEFCVQYGEDGECRLGLALPKRTRCRDFDPSLERFCSNPADFVSEAQLVQMAVFFDIKGPELKRVRIVATREEARRAAIATGARRLSTAAHSEKEI